VSEEVAVDQNAEVNQQVDLQPEPSEPKTSESKPIIPICQHIKDDGLRCGTPAVKGRNFCYYHCRVHFPGARVGTRRYPAPVPDSAASLQVALAHALRAVSSGKLPVHQANSIMYGVNLGTNLLRLAKPLTEAERQQVVTEVPVAMAEVLNPTGDDYEDEDSSDDELAIPRSQAMKVLNREIRRLRSMCQPPDKMQQYEEHVRTLRGTPDPRYYTACERISHHDEAVKKLKQMGVPIEDDNRKTA
jgi:hypothetical protein